MLAVLKAFIDEMLPYVWMFFPRPQAKQRSGKHLFRHAAVTMTAIFCLLPVHSPAADSAAPAEPAQKAEPTSTVRPLIRFGMLDIERESTYLNRNDNVQGQTMAWLREKLPQYQIAFRSYTISQLAEEIRKGRIDAFLSSSGFFVEMWPYGVKDLATLASNEFPNPNECVGGAIVVRSHRDDLQTIDDLKNLAAASTNPQNFMAFQLGMSAIAEKGYNTRKFFKRIVFTNNEPRQVLQLLLDGKADVALLRACFLESLTAKEPAFRGQFKVIEPLEANAACQYSTDLYPGWTVAVTDKASPRMAADLAEALLAKPKMDERGYYWGIATDYRSVNEVFRKLKIGPFEYLNHWTLERFWDAYRQYIFLAIFALLAWIGHWLSVERLVKKRTAELREAIQTQAELHEKALAAAGQLEKLTKFGVINELSAIYAHELAQPLTSMGYLTKTLENVTDRLPADAKEKPLVRRIAGKIGADLAKAEAILSRVRQYAKSTIKRDAAVDLSALTNDVVAKASKIYPKTVFSASLDDGVVVKGDSLELSVLALNLIRNAAESTTNGLVDVSVRITSENRAEAADAKEFACLSVKNAGEPLPYEPGEAAAFAVPSAKTHGMGMGLLIVQSILKAHGGKLRYKAENGVIVFSVFLPVFRQ